MSSTFVIFTLLPLCSDLKFVLYSGHDMTMMTMLYVLGVYDFKWPKYAADVKIELYQDKVCSSLQLT